TSHEVEVVEGRKVEHRFCDEHASEHWRTVRDRSQGRYCGTTKLSWGEWLQRQWGMFRDRPEVEWPVRVVFPMRMVPDAPTACAVCGEPATDREFEFAEDGTLLRDEARCVTHGGRPTDATRHTVSRTMNRWPVTCERCKAVATVRVNAVEQGKRTTHHYCSDHAADGGLTARRAG